MEALQSVFGQVVKPSMVFLSLGCLASCTPKPIDAALAAMDQQIVSLDGAIKAHNLTTADTALRELLRLQASIAPYNSAADGGQQEHIFQILQRSTELVDRAMQLIKQSDT
jgi:hypothetical protein